MYTFLGGIKIEIASSDTAFILLLSDFEKSQDGLSIAVNKYSVGQGPDLARIQALDVLKEMIKDKDTPLFKLEVCGFDPPFEIGSTYDISKG